jgi:hypothetical protein
LLATSAALNSVVNTKAFLVLVQVICIN